MGFAERIRGNSFYDEEQERVDRARAASPAANPDGFEVLLVKPSQFEEGTKIADKLSGGRVIILNLDDAAKDIARRLLDFLSGAAYARHCEVERVASNTYLIRNIDSVQYEDGGADADDSRYLF